MKRYLVPMALFVAVEATAQTYQGGVRGAVRDSTGIIPRITVTLTNERTNQARTSMSNDQGQCGFANVPPGVYTVAATVPGFKPFARASIEVGVQRFVILDIVLEIGTIEETITVTGDSPLLETATASNASSLEAMEMVTLPTPSQPVLLIRHDTERRAERRPTVPADARSERDVRAVHRRRPSPRQQLHPRRRPHHRSPKPPHVGNGPALLRRSSTCSTGRTSPRPMDASACATSAASRA